MNVFSKLIRERRVALNLSPKDLATRCNLDPSLLSRYERGNRTATRKHVLLLADALLSDRKDFLKVWWLHKIKQNLKNEEPEVITAVAKELAGSLENDSSAAIPWNGEGLKQMDELRRLNKLWQAKKAVYGTKELVFNAGEELYMVCESCMLAGNSVSYPEAKEILEKGIMAGGKSFSEHLQLINCWETWLLLKEKAKAGNGISGELWDQIIEKAGNGISSAGSWYAKKVKKPEMILPFLFRKPERERKVEEIAEEAVRIHLCLMDPENSHSGLISRIMTNFHLVSNGFPVILFRNSGKEYSKALRSFFEEKKEEEISFLILKAACKAIQQKIEWVEEQT
jgi:transcriptional regulator with XRE-family HTH domain